jgi:hypothetical protein
LNFGLVSAGIEIDQMPTVLFAILAIASVIAAFYGLDYLKRQCSRGRIDHTSALFLGVAIISFSTLIVLLFMLREAGARPDGQFDNSPEIRKWFQNLMRPDMPASSCCGEADAYWCDDYYARDDKAYCKITDDRDDEPRHRPHIDIGTEIEIPKAKLKWDSNNPTGHSIIFLGVAGMSFRYVLCFVQSTGI